MKAGLLDINVLLALAWPNHQHHAAAHRWFATEAKHGWATCSLVEVGFIRLSSNPAYSAECVAPAAAADLLQALVSHEKHQLWESPTASVPGIYQQAIGHQQVNDAYLVEVARFNGGRLITFDGKIAVHAAGTETVCILKA